MSRPRRAAVAGAGAVVLTAALITALVAGLLARRGEPGGSDASQAAAAGAANPGAPAAPASAGAASSSPSPGRMRPSPHAEAFELCGIGTAAARPPRSPSEAESADPWQRLPPHLTRFAQEDAFARTLERLQAGGPRERAAALALAGGPPAGRAPGPELAALALASGDPAVAQWAASACAFSACPGFSPRDRIRVDPGNLVPWLDLLAAEPAAEAEVVAGLVAAQRHRVFWGQVTSTMLAAVPADVAPYLQLQLAVYAIGVDAAAPMGWLQPLATLCKPQAGVQRHPAVCSHVAAVMADERRADTVLANRFAIRLAEWNGLPATEAAQRRAALDRQQETAARWLVGNRQPWGCTTVLPMLKLWRDMPETGELGAWRAQGTR